MKELRFKIDAFGGLIAAIGVLSFALGLHLGNAIGIVGGLLAVVGYCIFSTSGMIARRIKGE